MKQLGRYLYRTGNHNYFKQKINTNYDTEEEFANVFCTYYKYLLDNEKITWRI